MSQYNQNQPPAAYPAQAPAQQPYVVPPPAGYPMKDYQGDQGTSAQNYPPVQTQSRGDGFWKGCCAGLCCCCALDICF